MKPRTYFVYGATFLVLILVPCVIQKATALEDRFVTQHGHSLTSVYGNKITVLHNVQGFGSRSRFQLDQTKRSATGIDITQSSGNPYHVGTRDWTYLPPYFRWFYGGK